MRPGIRQAKRDVLIELRESDRISSSLRYTVRQVDRLRLAQGAGYERKNWKGKHKGLHIEVLTVIW